MKFLIRICVVLALFAAAPAQAVEIKIGDMPIAVPAPEGFVEMSRESAEMDRLGHVLTPPGNRFYAMFLPKDEAEGVRNGQQPTLERYMTVQTLKDLEFEPLGNWDIRQIIDAVREDAKQGLEKYRDDVNRVIDSQINANAPQEARLSMETSVPLDIYLDEETALGSLQKIRYKTPDGTMEVAVAMTVAVIKRKVVYLYVFKQYEGEDDADWARRTALDWIEQIYIANKPKDYLAERNIKPRSSRSSGKSGTATHISPTKSMDGEDGEVAGRSVPKDMAPGLYDMDEEAADGSGAGGGNTGLLIITLLISVVATAVIVLQLRRGKGDGGDDETA